MSNPPHHRPLDFLADIVVVREHLGTEACPLAFRPAGVFAAAGLYIAYAEKMAEGKGASVTRPTFLLRICFYCIYI